MLGKRPHQIQRTTSMSQLRVPPQARPHPRTPARDFMPQRPRKPADVSVHPKSLLQESLRLDVAELPVHAATGIVHHTDTLPPTIPNMHNMQAGPLLPASSTTSRMPSSSFDKHSMSESFMNACYSCKKLLGHGRDIYMYRGDAAFCSEDCRLRQITYDECRQKCSMPASQDTSIAASTGAPIL
ncbi:hypothetical protein L7F22_025163 [Adiantum nelumboides]|nr:hypothetical protein [Adiantum nelumboides]